MQYTAERKQFMNNLVKYGILGKKNNKEKNISTLHHQISFARTKIGPSP